MQRGTPACSGRVARDVPHRQKRGGGELRGVRGPDQGEAGGPDQGEERPVVA